MSKFIIRIKDASFQDGKVRKLTGNATLPSFAELITHSELDANPRTAKKSTVTDDIASTLYEMPELFQYMSKGILFAARGLKALERERFEIVVENPEKEGVLDGGHNTFTIGRYILEKTGYENFESVRSWGDLKKHWDIHSEVIRDSKAKLPDVLIPIEIVYPADTPEGEQEFEDSVLAISAARNNNAQLKEATKANQAGLYEELKKSLDPELVDQVEWKTNDGGRIKAQDVVSLALIALSVLPEEKYSVSKKLKESPTVFFSSKGQCVKLFNEFMEQEGVTQKISGDRKLEIVDPIVISALKLMKDFPRLHDLIYLTLPDAYNSASSGFGRIKSVRILNPEKAKDDPKSYMRTPSKTKFYQKEAEVDCPDGFLYPLIYALTELIHVGKDDVRWKTDPDKFIEENLSSVLKSGYQAIISGKNYEPAPVGKDKGAYQLASTMYRVSEHI